MKSPSTIYKYVLSASINLDNYLVWLIILKFILISLQTFFKKMKPPRKKKQLPNNCKKMTLKIWWYKNVFLVSQ